MKAVAKYLARYAEPNLSSIIKLCRSAAEPFSQATLIPCFAEGSAFVSRFALLPGTTNELVVLVLNAPPSASEQQRQQTLATQKLLLEGGEQLGVDESQSVGLYRFHGKTFLCINLLQSQFKPWQQFGVGYARKLGMDACLALHHQGLLQQIVVRSTDADVRWPDQYLSIALDPDPATSLYIFPFEHDITAQSDPQNRHSAQTYDRWLRYYVAGLTWAGSPWRFHTIGSTMAINLAHYAINRGFPKREAGEDFYLMNKLAKSGRVVTLAEPLLTLSARLSERTPFGTGASLNKLVSGQLQHWPFYHPECFNQLRHWQQFIAQATADCQLQFAPHYQPLSDALDALGVTKLLNHCRQQSTSVAQFRKHLRNGFDAHQTRRLIHWLQRHHFPPLKAEQVTALGNQFSFCRLDSL